MDDMWSTVRGQGKASRRAHRGYNDRRGAFSRLDPDYQGENRGTRQHLNANARSRGGHDNRGPSTYGRGNVAWRGQPQAGRQRPYEAPSREAFQPRGQVAHNSIKQRGANTYNVNYKQTNNRQPSNNSIRHDTAVNANVTGLMEALKNIQQTVGELQRRIDSLQPTERQRKPAGQDQARPSRDTPAEAESSNAQFGKLVKTTYRYVQVNHHKGNWSQVPKGMVSSINKVVSNIKPPMPAPGLSDELLALGLEFGEKIALCVRKHLSNCKDVIAQELRTLDSTDVDRAIQVAGRQLEAKLGKKIDATSRQTWLTEARNLTSSRREEGGLDSATGGAEWTSDASAPRTRDPQPHTSTVPSVQEGGKCTRGKLCITVDSRVPIETPSKKRRLATYKGNFDLGHDMLSDEEALGVTPLQQEHHDYRLTPPRPNVSVHSKVNGRFNANIHVNNKCSIFVIGDSNLQRLKGMPDHFQVESFRGAKFSHLTEVIDNLSLPDNVTDIVVAAGINHRDATCLETEVLPSLHTLLATLRRTRRKISFLLVSIPEHFSEKQHRILTGLNSYIRGGDTEIGWINSLPDMEVETISDGIHYNQATLDKLSTKLISKFQHFLD